MKYTMLKYKLVAGLCCVASMLLSGCINDYLDECYYLRVKIVNAKGEEITGSVAASLYIYDETGKYLETKRFDAADLRGYPAVKLDYPANKKLQIISWSEVEGTSLNLTRGDKMEDLVLEIGTKAEGQKTPDQAYLGNIAVTATVDGGITSNDTIVLRPQIGEIFIYTAGFQYALNNRVGLKSALTPDCDYDVNNVKKAFDYKGDRVGSDLLNPETTWSSGELLSVPASIAAGDTLDVALNVNGELLDTRLKDVDGNYIIPPAGEQVVVVFEYGEDGALIGVHQAIREWGVVDDDIIF